MKNTFYFQFHVQVFCFNLGVVLKEHRRSVMEDDDRSLTISHQFKEFTYWNLDNPPSADDKLKRAMDWIDIAKAVSHCVINLNYEDIYNIKELSFIILLLCTMGMFERRCI